MSKNYVIFIHQKPNVSTRVLKMSEVIIRCIIPDFAQTQNLLYY